MIESLLRPEDYYVSANQFFVHHEQVGIQPDINHCNKSKDYQRLIVNGSDEDNGLGHHEIYLRRLQDLNRPFVLLTGDPRAHDPARNIYWYQDSYFWSLKNFDCTHIDTANLRRFRASAISRLVRPHRIFFFLRWIESAIPQDCLMIMRKGQMPWVRPDDLVLDQTDHELWARHCADLPDQTDINFKRGNDHVCWTDTYLHVVLESTVNSYAHMTEKTWRPIVSGQLFLVYGNPGSVSTLRQQGVDVFDDIIDHHCYDHIQDAKQRAFRVLEQVKKLLAADLPSIWIATQDRRQKNIERFWGQKFVPSQCLDLAQTLNS